MTDHPPRRWGLLAGLSAALLTACSGGVPQVTGAADGLQPVHGTVSSDRPQYPFGLACGWQVASNIDLANVAFPDESAKYWVALVPMLPQTRLRIDGRYGAMRYVSYNVYDPLLRPTDALADVQLAPDDGGRNPFVDPSVPPGDRYTAWVEFTAPPEERARNTLYAGAFSLGPASAPQPALTALIYRSYVPADSRDFTGGVGLPLLTLETASGDVELLPTADCVEPLLPTLGDTLPSLGINEALVGIDVIDDPFLNLTLLPIGDSRASTQVFYGLPSTAVNLLRGFVGLPIPEGLEHQLPLPVGGGFLSNLHNAYTTNLFTRTYGNVAMIRAKAPTWRGQPGVAFGSEDMRYWSICQNDLPTQRYVGCVADDQVHLDADGYFTVMVSDAADRPVNAIAENHIDWLPWGPYIDALLIYRHMLPRADFAPAIHNVPAGTPPLDIMGDFMPQSAYCLPEIVEGAGTNPADIFAACRAYTESLQ